MESLHDPIFEWVRMEGQWIEVLDARYGRVTEDRPNTRRCRSSDSKPGMVGRAGQMRVIDYSCCTSRKSFKHTCKLAVEDILRGELT